MRITDIPKLIRVSARIVKHSAQFGIMFLRVMPKFLRYLRVRDKIDITKRVLRSLRRASRGG